MKSVVQVVKNASIVIDGAYGGSIKWGLVVLVAYRNEDTDETIGYLTDKILNLRVFPDENGKLNLSVKDVKGSVMLVSNFTLYGDAAKGRRPSYTLSAKPEISKPLFLKTKALFEKEITTVSGNFGSDMQISLVNDGPITLTLEA